MQHNYVRRIGVLVTGRDSFVRRQKAITLGQAVILAVVALTLGYLLAKTHVPDWHDLSAGQKATLFYSSGRRISD
jgi:hypothetical protein